MQILAFQDVNKSELFWIAPCRFVYLVTAYFWKFRYMRTLLSYPILFLCDCFFMKLLDIFGYNNVLIDNFIANNTVVHKSYLITQ